MLNVLCNGMALTYQQIKNLKPKNKDYKKFDGEGLYILVRPNGSKVWRYKYRFQGREKTLTIGTYPPISLKLAREEHLKARLELQQGEDPSTQKQIRQGRVKSGKSSFLEVAEEWFAKNEGRWKENYKKKLRSNIFSNISKGFANKPIDLIRVYDVEKEVEKVDARGAHYLAGRFLDNIKRILNYAIRRRLIVSNPVQFLTAKDITTSYEQRHHPCIPVSETKQFFRKLNKSKSNKRHVLALFLFALVFVRSKELRMSKIIEFDLKNNKWVVPAQNMKSKLNKKEEHVVPLSGLAVKVIRELIKLSGESEYLLPQENDGSKHMDENATNNVIHEIGYKGRMCTHGFRTLASTTLHEQGFEPHVIERQLAHDENNAIKAAYNRAEYLEQRKCMMDAWGEYLEQFIDVEGIINERN